VRDERPVNNLGSTRLNVMPIADLAITAFTSPDPVVSAPGTGMLTYTLVYTNAGPWDARSVLITDVLPTGVTYGGGVYADPPLSDPTVRDERRNGRVQVLRWFVSDLPARKQGTLVFTTTLAARSKTPLRSKATIAGRVWDQDSANNKVMLATDVRRASLSVKQSPFTIHRLPPTIVPHMPLTYTVWVTNTGGVTLIPRLVQTLSPGFRYVASSGWPRDPDVVSMTVDLSTTVGVSPTAGLVWDDSIPLSPGRRISVSFAVEYVGSTALAPSVAELITASQATRATKSVTYVNPTLVTGTVAGVQVTATDAVSVYLTSPSVLVAQRVTGYKRVGSSNIGSGRRAPVYMTFTVQVSNTGPSALDVLPLQYRYNPANLHFVRAAPGADVVTQAGTLIWRDVSTAVLSATVPSVGAGRDLLPAGMWGGGSALSVTVVFSTVRPVLTGQNVAVVTEALDVYQNAVVGDKNSVSFPLIAQLESLHVRRTEGLIRLSWAATEIDDVGYRVLQADEPRFSDATDVAFIPSKCRQTLCQATYVYTDTAYTSGDEFPWYWVVAVDVLGDERRYGPVRPLSPTLPGEEDLLPTLFIPLVMRQP
jgi:uncharacterized repeat protein (TIGR01451 family)